MAASDTSETVVAYMALPPPPVSSAAAEAVVAPPPMAADAVVTPPPMAEAVTVAPVAPPPMSADAAPKTAVAPPPPVLLLLPPPPEKTGSESVMSGGEEEPSQGDINKTGYITERNKCEQDSKSLPMCDIECGESYEVPSISSSIDQESYLKVIDIKENETDHCSLVLPEVTVLALGHLLEEEQPSMLISENKESEKQIPPPPCPSDEQQKPKDNGDLSDGSPTNSSDQSDHSDDEHHYNFPMYSYHHHAMYRFMHGREGRNCGYSHSFSATRKHWNDDYSSISCFGNQWNHMASLHDDHWGRWPSPESDQRKKRYNSGSCWSWSSPELNCEKKSYTVGAGLSNPHFWTCFVNCVLQCMVHTVPLVLKLRKVDHPDPCPRASIGFCCHCSLKEHVDESIRLSGSYFYPVTFVSRLKSISSDFESGVQQDAQEFLSCLLDKLDEDSIAPISSEECSLTEEGGVAKEIFGGCLKSQLRCPACNLCSDKSEPFLDLSLELNMVETLKDALQSFTKTELIEDFMCDGCKSRVNMEKHFKVEQAPEVLVIHLKRFTNSEYKILDKIKYPLELDINSFMSSSDDTLQKYDLYGVVEHLGAYGRGHYVSYIRSSEADWYKFNDDRVYKCSVASALESTAYLLFYVKQGSSPWFSTLLEKKDKFPLDDSVGLEEQGEIALFNKEEEATTSYGQGSSGSCLAGPAEENGNGPTLPDLSEQLQRNGNVNTLSYEPDNLEEGCRLGEASTGTQRPSCLLGSGDKEPSDKMKDFSPRGSLNRKEMKPSTCGSLEVDHAVTQGGSPQNENNGRLLQLSHKRRDHCYHSNFSLLDEIGGCCGAPSMGMCTSENERVESNTELRDDNKGTSGGEEGRGRRGGKRKKWKSADGGEYKASSKRRKMKHRAVARHFALCRRIAMAGIVGKLKKRRR